MMQKESLYNSNELESHYLLWAPSFFYTAWTLLDKLSCNFLKKSSGIVLQASRRIFQSSSLDVGCIFFRFLPSRWSHTASIMLRWGLWKGSSLHKTRCQRFSVHFLCHLAYLRLFFLFTFLKNGFLTATLPLRPFLMRLGPTVDGSVEGPDVSLRSCVRSLLDFLL